MVCVARVVRMRSRTVPPKAGPGFIFAANSGGTAMGDDVITLLKVHDYFHGVSDETLQEVVRHARVALHPAGGVVHEASVTPTTVNFVLRGRLKAVRIDVRGESLFRMIERGEQFGM